MQRQIALHGVIQQNHLRSQNAEVLAEISTIGKREQERQEVGNKHSSCHLNKFDSSQFFFLIRLPVPSGRGSFQRDQILEFKHQDQLGNLSLSLSLSLSLCLLLFLSCPLSPVYKMSIINNPCSWSILLRSHEVYQVKVSKSMLDTQQVADACCLSFSSCL